MERVTTASLEWLENPQVSSVNRLQTNSVQKYYDSKEAYLRGEEIFKQHLNGIWKLHWSQNLEERPKDFMNMDYDTSEFIEVSMPVQNTNVAYLWDNNAVGSYVKEFDLEEGLIGKRICVSFHGIDQAIYVWLNGVFIGYSEDFSTPSEFDLTEWIKEKGNRLCVEVYKRNSVACADKKDLFRKVFLYAKPESHIEDLKIVAEYEPEAQKGIFTLHLDICGNQWEQVFCKLRAADGTFVFEQCFLKHAEVVKQIYFDEIEIEQVQPWDLKKPYLYQLTIEVRDEMGNFLEFIPYQVGFLNKSL